MTIETSFLTSRIRVLELSVHQIKAGEQEEDETFYEVYRKSIISEFETVMDQSGKLLRKCLLPYFPSKNKLDALVFNDIFREAGHHGILTAEEVRRWLTYRENRNDTDNDHGAQFAEWTLTLMPQFITDADALVAAIEKINAAAAKG